MITLFDKRKRIKNQSLYTLHTIIRTIVITIISTTAVLLILSPIALRYQRRVTSARVLTNARTALIAIHTVGMDCFGQNRVLADSTSPYGITESAREQVLRLADSDGEIYLIQWDPKELQADQMFYTEEGYMVSFLRDEEGVKWEVSRMDTIISHE